MWLCSIPSKSPRNATAVDGGLGENYDYDSVQVPTTWWLRRLIGPRRRVVRSIISTALSTQRNRYPAVVLDFAGEIMRLASQAMARQGTTAGVTAHFPAGDGIDPQSRMQ